ncbi:hypothetical protein JTE90_012660 [Oedothorax gibbosus]|uniref:Uncharacterized protein n=1 Tax=Oedothorax gibbosus TaxID=931172 RepID=A0AAV6U1N2_9ARAC|nr:hypothetical protein JTE90_012660 [Oedothorax gibbosus]
MATENVTAEEKLDMVDENEEKEVVADAQEPGNEGQAEKEVENERDDMATAKREEKPGSSEMKEADDADRDKVPVKWIRSKRPTSVMKTKLLVKDVVKFIEEMKKKITQEDLNLRVWPHLASCRFELPIDLTRLEDLTPLKYVSQYCRVTDSRRAVYAAKYERHLQQSEGKSVLTSDLREVYEKIYQEPKLADEMLHLRRLLDMDLNEELDVELFTAVSCVMERVIVKSKGLEISQENTKNAFEETDFCALRAKLNGLQVSPSLRSLLEFIRNA